MRMRIPIPYQMGRISNHRDLVGTWISFLWWWQSIGWIQTTTSTMKKSYIKQLLTWPWAKFTLKLPIIPEEGSDKNFLIEQLEATEWLIDKMLHNYWKTPFIYPTYTSFLDYFLQLSDEYCYNFSFPIYLIHILTSYATLPRFIVSYTYALPSPFPLLHVPSFSAAFYYSSYLCAAYSLIHVSIVTQHFFLVYKQ